MTDEWWVCSIEIGSWKFITAPRPDERDPVTKTTYMERMRNPPGGGIVWKEVKISDSCILFVEDGSHGRPYCLWVFMRRSQ